MFSVTNTGTNFRPLCTAKVRPTASGAIVERRDQVRMTFLLFVATASLIFSMRCPSMNGPFFTERGIFSALLPAALDDHAVGPLVVARLQALGELAPRRAGMTSAARATLATAHRVIDRVHRDAAVVRPLAEPPGASCLADRNVLVIGVRHLSDRRAALEVHETHLAARQPDLSPRALFGHELRGEARR